VLQDRSVSYEPVDQALFSSQRPLACEDPFSGRANRSPSLGLFAPCQEIVIESLPSLAPSGHTASEISLLGLIPNENKRRLRE